MRGVEKPNACVFIGLVMMETLTKGEGLEKCFIVEFIVYVVSEGKGFDRVFGRVLTALQMLLNIAVA